MLNSYMDFNSTSEQYQWLVKDLATVWVWIVFFLAAVVSAVPCHERACSLCTQS
jgi:hypothetical protein